MNKARNLLINASQKLELPTDVVAGIPRIEIIGSTEMSLEPHKGLVEYSEEKISVLTSIGTISAVGSGLTIKRMNGARITVTGNVYQVQLCGG